MPDLHLELTRADHEAAVLEFERVNRPWFNRFIGDRGDDYFTAFAAEHAAVLAKQAARESLFYLLLDERGTILGRFNLYRIEGTEGEVGYRVAERVAGRGVATEGLRQLCRIAAEDLGLTRLLARTSEANVASQRVLLKAGFAATGPCEGEGWAGTAYELELGAG